MAEDSGAVARNITKPANDQCEWRERAEEAAHILKQPGHLTSMKNEFGVCTRRFNLCFWASTDGSGCSKSVSYGDCDGWQAQHRWANQSDSGAR